MARTHPDRQAKLLYALNKLGASYQRCAQCNASEGNASDLHTVTQVPVSFDVKLDQEPRDERDRAGNTVLGGSRQRRTERAVIVCRRCGFVPTFDLNILEKHI